MKYSARREKTVGGLTFLGLVLAILISYGKSDETGNEQTYKVSATFSRIDGLVEESDVRMGGVRIGYVLGADLNENYRAVVTMAIEKNVRLPLDTSAAIHTDGLFGNKFIELEPGGDENYLNNGGRIDMAQSSVVVEELLELIIAEGKSKRAQKEE
ncbi:MAG: outer membrane lipid asymmetry maintenance protein MlaD [Terasakiella sp.]|uniref:outer membrane lipid asymmetry maintenance protein MlaD n=1 Tax=unclassified Terasakiella TaxID=2614952 RepID=UPI003B001FAB